METVTKLRHWGSSLGIIVPSEIVKKESLREGEDVIVQIKKRETIGDLFGSLKGFKINAQKVKDESRKTWGK